MKNKLLVITLTGILTLPLSSVAEVNITGQAQLEAVNTSASDGAAADIDGTATSVKEGLSLDDASESGIPGTGNATMLGITGSHALGNGMTGIYKFNFNFKSDDQEDGISDRDQFIGLKGDFGTILLGTMNTPYKSTTVSWDPFLATFMQARGNNGMSKTAGLYNGYGTNVLAYANKAGKTKYIIAIDVDETEDSNGDYAGDHGYHLGINTSLSPKLELAFGVLTESGDSTADPSGTATKLGLRWKGDGISVAAQFETEDEDLGDQDHLYVNYVKSLGKGASAAIAVGSRTDNSDAENDGTYVAVGFKKTLNQYVSWHAGIVSIDEGVVSKGEDASQVGAGIRVKF